MQDSTPFSEERRPLDDGAHSNAFTEELLPLVRKDSIEELVGHRDCALQLARDGLERLVAAEAAAKRAAGGDEYAGFVNAITRDRLHALRSRGAIDEVMKHVRQKVDEYAWASLQKLSGLRNIMDATAHEQMSTQLSTEAPPFTIDNIVATFTSLAAQARQIFERSLVNVFKSLDTRHYRTNSAFRIGPRVVLASMFSHYGFEWRKQSLIADLDRIFHTLDEKKAPAAGNAADAIEAAYRAGEATCITEYFEARMFRGNGNLHLKFRRLDLVDRANDIISRHYATRLPDDRKTP